MSLRRGLQRLLHFSLDTAHQPGQRAAAEAKSGSRYRWYHLYQQYNTSSAPSSFEPSRLYPKQYYRTSEDYAFWGIVGISLAGMLATKTDAPGLRDQLLQHCRTSVEALYGGRVYTLLTSSWAHASAWHLAANMAAMAFYRRTVRLSGRELLSVFLLGSIAGAVTHTAYYWYDAAGPELGPLYSANTPALMGCGSGVAAVLAYKLFFEPHATPLLLILPAPLFFAVLLFPLLEVKEKEYCDGPPAKLGGVAVGLLCAAASMATRRRLPIWMAHRAAAAGAVR